MAAQNIHKRLLMAILSAPVSFFDITPVNCDTITDIHVALLILIISSKHVQV